MSTMEAEQVDSGGRACRDRWLSMSTAVAEEVEAEAEDVGALAVDVAMEAEHVESAGRRGRAPWLSMSIAVAEQEKR